MCPGAQTDAPPSVLITIQSRIAYGEDRRLAPYSTFENDRTTAKPTAVELFAGLWDFCDEPSIEGLKYFAKTGESRAAWSLPRHA